MTRFTYTAALAALALALPLVAAASGEHRRLTNSSARDDRAVYTADGSKIVFTSDRTGVSQVFAMNVDGSGVRQVTTSQSGVTAFDVSPDGTRIAFVQTDAGGNADVYVAGVDGSGITNVSASDAADIHPAWAPDGSRIAFSSYRDGDADVFAVRADGSGLAKLTSSPGADDQQPAWSPDGMKVAFVRGDHMGYADIYSVAAAGGPVTRLTFGGGHHANPRWSPDGTKIAYQFFLEAESEVVVMNADGSGRREVSGGISTLGGPTSWAPDSARLAFTVCDPVSGSSCDVVVARSDGSERTVVTTAEADDYLNDGGISSGTQWAPDGRTLVFASNLDDPNYDVYTVAVAAPYAFTGFFAPLRNLPVLNAVRAGAAVPVKFSLGGDHGLDVFASGYPASRQITCDTGVPISDVTETATAGASTLTYAAGADTYTYVWKTSGGWSDTCRALIVRLGDGSEHTAHFLFR